jgi:hypothetical protein
MTSKQLSYDERIYTGRFNPLDLTFLTLGLP